MKIISIFLSLIVVGQVNSQIKSYYFSQPVPGTMVYNVSPQFYGNYEDGKGRVYSFSDSGVYLLSTTVSSISRETIRESSKYRLSNGYLYGVVSNDSVPYIEDGDHYVFGVRNRDMIVSKQSLNKLVHSIKFNDTYYLNIYENGVYNLMRLKFVKGELQISSFDYEPGTTIFEQIVDQRSDNQATISLVLLKPTEEEFNALLQYGIFDNPIIYKRIRL